MRKKEESFAPLEKGILTYGLQPLSVSPDDVRTGEHLQLPYLQGMKGDFSDAEKIQYCFTTFWHV